MGKVLIVEDEVDLCKLIASQIRTGGNEVVETFNAEEGLKAISQDKFDLLITDIRLPGMDGIEMVKKIVVEISPRPAIFVMSGYSDYTTDDIIAAGGERFFSKPAGIADLFVAVTDLFKDDSKFTE